MLEPGERDAQLKKNADIQSEQKKKFDEKYLEIVKMVEKYSKKKQDDNNEDENDFLTNIDNRKLLEPFKKHYQKEIDQKGKQLSHMQDLVDYLDELLEHARENDTEVNEIKSQNSHIINIMNTLKHDLANLTVLVNKGN